MTETRAQLPDPGAMTTAQQRGTACAWCAEPLGTDLGVDLGEQRIKPATGAAYSWFPRECLNALACAGRRATR